MLASAMNFAIGFFGYPFEGQYQQSITIEADKVCVSSVLPPLTPYRHPKPPNQNVPDTVPVVQQYPRTIQNLSKRQCEREKR
jgi:hypothetical protein